MHPLGFCLKSLPLGGLPSLPEVWMTYPPQCAPNHPELPLPGIILLWSVYLEDAAEKVHDLIHSLFFVALPV